MRSLLTLSVLLTASVLLSGCFYSREIARTRRDIERQYPDARFDREIVVSLGPGTMRFAGFIARLVPEDEADMASDYLRDVSRVKVGVYRIEALPDLADFDLSRLERFRREDGWELAAKTREDDEVVWVMYRERDDTIRDLYVFVLSDEEFVMARVQGRLSRLFERVMQDHMDLTDLIGRY